MNKRLLPQRRRLVAFDLRGHGNGDLPWRADACDSAQPWGDEVAKVIAARALEVK
jgi:pimeloyl-ACP methyl ester carboxylesterase